MLARINGLDTYYTVEGRGEPVVLLHGWGASSQSLAPLCGALADAFRVLAVDSASLLFACEVVENLGNPFEAGGSDTELDAGADQHVLEV